VTSTDAADRRDALVDLADEAGFGAVEVIPIDNDFFRFYRLRRS